MNKEATSGFTRQRRNTVNELQLLMGLMVASDPDWRDNRPNPSRQLSAEELDAIADFGWHFPALKRLLASWSNAVHARWQAASRKRSPKPTLAPVARGKW
jgi:hypothetical protein